MKPVKINTYVNKNKKNKTMNVYSVIRQGNVLKYFKDIIFEMLGIHSC